MFFDRELSFPRRWSEMALDYKAFFISFIVVMLMFMAGGALPTQVELAVEAALLIGLSVLLVWRRLKDGWRWAGAGPPQLLNAAASLVFAVVFLVATLTISPIGKSAMLPWYLGIANIGLFNLLIALRIVRPSQAAYERDCRPPEEDQSYFAVAPDTAATDGADPNRLIRIAFQVAFVAVWFAGMAFVFSEGAAHPSPETLKDIPILAPMIKDLAFLQSRAIHLALGIVMFVGGPCVVLGGFYLQNIAGIQVLPGLPARRMLDRSR